MQALYTTKIRSIHQWLTSVILIPFALYFIFKRGDFTLLDNINLIIHEAGHFFFMFFGKFIHAAGGTLMQIIFPLFIAAYFFRNSNRPAVQIFLFWLAQNLINISVYADDANKLKLVLLGNCKHDWLYMLGRFRMLEYADIIGNLFYIAAIFMFIFAILIPAFKDRWS